MVIKNKSSKKRGVGGRERGRSPEAKAKSLMMKNARRNKARAVEFTAEDLAYMG